MIAAVKPKRTAPPVPQPACTCGSLRKASRRISQFYDTALAPVGLKSTQFSILSEVERRSAAGSVTMCELAAAMVMDRSTLGHNLRPLERDDLVVLRLARDDRRKRYVELTHEGKAMLLRARRLWSRAENRFEAIFGKQPAAELRAVLLSIANSRELIALPES
ncbi:MAG: regulatory protein MarR [Gammaproteobacteria bacterium]|nr:regulatory protein MarR [Gammaproteobacteria bacterium]